MYLFSAKIGENDSRKSFSQLLDSILYALSFSVRNIAPYFYDLGLA